MGCIYQEHLSPSPDLVAWVNAVQLIRRTAERKTISLWASENPEYPEKWRQLPVVHLKSRRER